MSYKLLTDASRGFNNTFNYMIRDGKRYIEEKELESLKLLNEKYKKMLELIAITSILPKDNHISLDLLKEKAREALRKDK